jgi:alanine dehydrogenase
VARTSTFSLTNVTLPYAMEIADRGLKAAARNNKAIAKGVNVFRGKITHPGVAESMGCPFTELSHLLC